MAFMDIYSCLANSSVCRYCQTLFLLESLNTLTKCHKIESKLDYVLGGASVWNPVTVQWGMMQTEGCI